MPFSLKTHHYVLLIVLLLASYLRLHDISGYMTFLGDEGRDVLIVKRMIVDHKFTLLGPTASVGGFFLGPIYYYFMLPFLWLWQLDPTGPAVMVALFGTATVALVYKVAKEFSDAFTGLVAATMYAMSPLVIAYSRSSWNPNLVPFFSTLLILLLWQVLEKKQWWLSIGVGVILGIGLQLHYLFLFLFPVVGVLTLFYTESIKFIRFYIFLLIGFLIGYSPFLGFEIRHNFPNTWSVVRFILQGKDTGFSFEYFLKTISDIFFRLFGRLVFRFPQPGIFEAQPVVSQFMWAFSTVTAIISSLFILSREVFLKLKGNKISLKTDNKSVLKGSSPFFLSVWLIVVVVLFGFYKKGIYDYYFGIMFALPFILVAIVIRYMYQWKTVRPLALIVICLLFVLNWDGRPFKFPPNNQLDQAKLIANAVLAKTDNKSFNFALITNSNSDHAYRYFLEVWGHKPVAILNEDNDPKRLTVTDQLLVICEVPDCQPLGNPLWEVAGFGRAQIEGVWNVSFVKLFKLIHYNEKNR